MSKVARPSRSSVRLSEDLCRELRELLNELEMHKHLIKELSPRKRLFAELLLMSKNRLLEACS